MTVDWSRLIDRLDPPSDGETPIRHRTGSVIAVNSDGTVDVDFIGSVVPSVAVLSGASVNVGAIVQVVVWEGDLLVLGAVAQSPAAIEGGEHRDLAGLASITFAIPAGANLIHFGWTGRTDQGTTSNTPVRLEFDGDTGANYDRALAFFDSAGFSVSSLFAVSALSGIVIGRAGGNAAHRESSFDGTIIRSSTRAVVVGTGVTAIGANATDQLTCHGGGRYRIAAPALTQLRIFLAGGPVFSNGNAYVEAR